MQSVTINKITKHFKTFFMPTFQVEKVITTKQDFNIEFPSYYQTNDGYFLAFISTDAVMSLTTGPYLSSIRIHTPFKSDFKDAANGREISEAEFNKAYREAQSRIQTFAPEKILSNVSRVYEAPTV